LEKRQKSSAPEPFYDLDEVKRLINEDRVFFSLGAVTGARECFGWDISDIKKAIRKLNGKHFYKSDVSKYDPYLVYDFYKAHNLNGENVYIHLFIDENEKRVIVNSFKEI
jgi:hypothetical protein